ncbi:MAG: methylase N-4/N-6 domain protein [Candidatus Jorgensenbacteria bacterium GW2011_GWA2_45_9]|uniref:Methylase N-4/N-6 domain protein n=1 Tax=Candidatus Jorgensenbacteria bacterium GW2011_GWA2_45_9 TaxID=1618663 RepID=A0A0G1N5J5_9BACT|nr:MAG: methylase N-4/N-6 domain protein [Candidatus Jorgensenbacteria bacterium GW2011_GWA2_45_9]
MNENVWGYRTGGTSNDRFSRKHDIILSYEKSGKHTFNLQHYLSPQKYKYGFGKKHGYELIEQDGKYFKNAIARDIWDDIEAIGTQGKPNDPRIGYPTQKPEALLERIIKASSNESDVIADFFCGGGTSLAAAQKLKRRFIGCDSKVPNIEVSYLGVYPTEKFASIPHDEFVDFVLTCYGASKNTAEGKAHGFRPPGQSEPILIGPADPKKSVSGKEVKAFFDEIKARLEPNKLVSAKIIGWRFDRQIVEYIKILEKYIEKHTLPLKLNLIPLDSKEFRARVLQRYPNIDEAEFFLRFSKAPVIGDIKMKKVGELEYEFEAIDAISTNEDGWLVNCQWDFDYQEGHFAADKDYVLSREKVTDKKKGERFKAVLKAKHMFEKSGEMIVACKVQDNLAGETIFSKKVKI